MPNNTDSVIEFKVSYEIKVKILDFIKGVDDNGDLRPLCFNKIIPMPSTIFHGDLGQKEKEIHGTNNWYDWSIENWGTKWDAYDTSICEVGTSNSENFILDKKSKTKVRVYFLTAWSPVPKILSVLSKNFPVKFIYAYRDEGGGFYGKDEYLNGVLIKSSENKTTVERFLRSLKSECKI